MSSAPTVVRSDAKVEPRNEWTIMIFFAGDPHLSPSMTSQLKAIKDAGFQENTTVLIHYDPNEKGVGTTTFNINSEQKRETRKNGSKGTRIGDGRDPFVRNLIEDSIPNGATRSQNAGDALRTFLSLALQKHSADHYMLFCVGHGVIVGNDFFLPDKQPDSAITLQQLGGILSDFKTTARMLGGGELELIGLHSCSMSAIEVAYQLKGAARYLMATEGISFVASWPYRQLLKKILKTIDDAKETGVAVDVDNLIHSVQRLSLHNSTDFMFSGLSADLCLSSLDPAKVDALTAPIQALSKALKKGLKDRRAVELISLAHLKAQSYWQETYTDLYDFCYCLEQKCTEGGEVQKEIAAACKAVRNKLEESPDGVIIQSDFFGPLFQYSHGYSVFFPWARPMSDVPQDDMLLKYKNYEFTKAFKDDSWLSFLEEYFSATERKSREEEDGTVEEDEIVIVSTGIETQATFKPVASSNGTSAVANIGAVDALEPPDGKASPALDMEKASPALTDGMGCSCNVKNYPMKFFMSPRALQDANAETSKTAQTRQPATVAG
jgi:cysteine peptidase C11 family protein